MAKRYTGGVTDMSYSDTLGRANLSLLDPRTYSVYHEDFSNFSLGALVTTNATAYYAGTVGISASAATVISLSSDADITGCALTFTAGATDTQYARIQVGTGGMVLESGKKAFMETKMEMTAATIATHFWAIGLLYPEAAGDTTNIADDTTFVLISDDTWAFFKDGNQSAVKGRSGENDVNTDATILATQVTATWYTWSCYYDGTDMYWFRDGVLIAKSTPSAVPVTPVAPTIVMITQKAEAVVLKVDYLTVICEM